MVIFLTVWTALMLVLFIWFLCKDKRTGDEAWGYSALASFIVWILGVFAGGSFLTRKALALVLLFF